MQWTKHRLMTLMVNVDGSLWIMIPRTRDARASLESQLYADEVRATVRCLFIPLESDSFGAVVRYLGINQFSPRRTNIELFKKGDIRSVSRYWSLQPPLNKAMHTGVYTPRKSLYIRKYAHATGMMLTLPKTVSFGSVSNRRNFEPEKMANGMIRWVAGGITRKTYLPDAVLHNKRYTLRRPRFNDALFR